MKVPKRAYSGQWRTTLSTPYCLHG